MSFLDYILQNDAVYFQWLFIRLHFIQKENKFILHTMFSTSKVNSFLTVMKKVALYPIIQICSPNTYCIYCFFPNIYVYMSICFMLCNKFLFSNTFQSVQAESEKWWYYHLYTVVTDYAVRIPSPLNLILRPIHLTMYLLKLARK